MSNRDATSASKAIQEARDRFTQDRFKGGGKSVKPDPEYDLVPAYPKKEKVPQSKGKQCGECGAKFEHNKGIMYSCPRENCPMGLGSVATLKVEASVA